MRVAVVGCGYVGLVSGVGLASLGHEVVGIETDGERISGLERGVAPFHEPGLDEALGRALAAGSFRPSPTLADAADADVILLCVQTPPTSSGGVELRFVDAATRSLSGVLAAGEPRRRVVAVRSTVPPGTADAVVAPLLAGVGSVAVASNPEFLREGSALEDFLHADRVVVGVREDWATELLTKLYEPLDAPLIVTTPPAAELAKYASNALLATLVSFSNQIARLAESTPGVDAEDVFGVIHRDRRLNIAGGDEASTAPIVAYLKAGCGFGGSCLPKDLSALIAYGRERGERVDLLEAVQDLNRDQVPRLVDLAERRLGGLDGRRIAVLGAAFKAGTDDLRESPGLRVVDELHARRASVVVYDPLVPQERLTELLVGADVAGSLEEAVEGADACLVTTLDPAWERVEALVRRRNGNAAVVVDGRRALDPAQFADAGYTGIGRAADR